MSNDETPVPAGWGQTRINKKWNGRCIRCNGVAIAGHRVAWDPNSGRPSAWRHINCAHPFDDKQPAAEVQPMLLQPPPAPQRAPAQPVRRPAIGPANGLAEAAVRTLLQAIGEDPMREGLQETPRRVVAMLREMCRREPFKFTAFASEGMDEMVVQSPIGFSSLCEHHMLPFIGTAAVAYIPSGKVVGLSKLARAVRCCAAGLQNQERITVAVADMIEKELQPQGVAVVLRARHLCMEVRGVKTEGAFTTTSCLRGAFKENGKSRDEFLRLAAQQS
jgi:GTP cyclohydrolase I